MTQAVDARVDHYRDNTGLEVDANRRPGHGPLVGLRPARGPDQFRFRTDMHSMGR